MIRSKDDFYAKTRLAFEAELISINTPEIIPLGEMTRLGYWIKAVCRVGLPVEQLRGEPLA